jgi:integrase
VAVVDVVDLFDLVEDTGRKMKLKIVSSARRVPIHSGLLGLGFIDYMSKRRRDGKGQPVKLFPNLRNSSVVSRFFMQTLRSLGITSRALTLHSARHAWETMLAHAGVQGEMRDRLLGHASAGSVGATVYLHLNWKVGELKEALEKVRFLNSPYVGA